MKEIKAAKSFKKDLKRFANQPKNYTNYMSSLTGTYVQESRYRQNIVPMR